MGFIPCSFVLAINVKIKNQSRNFLRLCVGVDLSSRFVSKQVLSALVSLTSVFGMGTGGPSPLKTPTIHQAYTLKTKQRKELLFTRLNLHNIRSSPRAISTSRLNTLLRLHRWPINEVVFLGPYSKWMGDLILRRVSRLDAFSVYLVQT